MSHNRVAGPTTNGGKCIGQLIDFIITTHTAYPELKERAKQEGKSFILSCWTSSKNCAMRIMLIPTRSLRSIYISIPISMETGFQMPTPE
ncbi:hypothetical protein F4604DRAFT_355983 [Suillus subluteus]|nr:hypothetical protein F4604DRAFT_355983 [Suillus subluteus]